MEDVRERPFTFSMASMAIDAQHRVVLPAHLVGYLGLERDVFFVCTNTTIQVWNPADYLIWSGRDAGPSYNADLNSYLILGVFALCGWTLHTVSELSTGQGIAESRLAAHDLSIAELKVRILACETSLLDLKLQLAAKGTETKK